jgi:hypothetical protein
MFFISCAMHRLQDSDYCQLFLYFSRSGVPKITFAASSSLTKVGRLASKFDRPANRCLYSSSSVSAGSILMFKLLIFINLSKIATGETEKELGAFIS